MAALLGHTTAHYAAPSLRLKVYENHYKGACASCRPHVAAGDLAANCLPIQNVGSLPRCGNPGGIVRPRGTKGPLVRTVNGIHVIGAGLGSKTSRQVFLHLPEEDAGFALSLTKRILGSTSAISPAQN